MTISENKQTSTTLDKRYYCMKKQKLTDEEKKKKRKEYLIAYQKEHYKRVPLDIKKDDYQELQSVAKKVKEPINAFIKTAIDERIERINQNE